MTTPNKTKTAALLTTGRIAPCFAPAVAFFIKKYSEIEGVEYRVIAYRHGFRGLLRGDSFLVGLEERMAADLLLSKGGSPLGASRTRLTNTEHLLSRGLIRGGEDAFEKCAAQLVKDNVDVLHIIGSSHAQKTGKRLSEIVWAKYQRVLRMIGVPKTIENDMYPIKMTCGAQTAAEECAKYFSNVVPEHNSNPRMLIIHEVKGRAAGWLTAATALEYRKLLNMKEYSPTMGLSRENAEIHAVYTPEMTIDFEAEIKRLKRVMDRYDNVNIFLAQGTCQEVILAEEAAKGAPMQKHDTLGYTVTNTALWFAERLKKGIEAQKVLIQKSGIYVRASACGEADLTLIQGIVDYAVEMALDPSRSATGVVGHNEQEEDGRLSLINISLLEGEKKFDLSTPWFVQLLAAIGQPQPNKRQYRKGASQTAPQTATGSSLKVNLDLLSEGRQVVLVKGSADMRINSKL